MLPDTPQVNSCLCGDNRDEHHQVVRGSLSSARSSLQSASQGIPDFGSEGSVFIDSTPVHDQ